MSTVRPIPDVSSDKKAELAARMYPHGRRTPLEAVGLVLGGVLLLLSAFRTFCYVQDDAFITYRYALNLHNGHGPVFNPGERTEGYSCPLYMVCTAFAMWLPGDVLLRAKLFGVCCALATLYAAWRLAAEMGLTPWARATVPVLLGCSGTVAQNAVDGMETALQMLLVTSAAALFVKEQRTGRGWFSAVLLLAAALNRPEGAVLIAAAAAFRCVGAARTGFRRDDGLWLASSLAPFAAFLLWRHAYYGYWLPNTYYAKRLPLASALDLSMGPAYLLRTVFVDLGGRLAPASVSVVLWICAVAGAISDRVRKHHAFVIPIFVAVQAAVALLSGGDWMTGWRYMTPVFALWMLLVVIGAKDIGRAIMGLRAGAVTSAAAGSAAVTALCGVLLWAGTEFRNPADGAVSWASKDWPTSVRGLLHGFRMQNTVTTADFLNGHVPAGSLLAFSEVGAVPYLTPELRWLDTYGLTDAEIAHSTGDRYRTGVTGDYTDSQSRAGKIVLQRRPDFIVRWISEDAQQGPILDGNYYPWMRTPVTSYDGPGRYVLQVWRRADRATRG